MRTINKEPEQPENHLSVSDIGFRPSVYCPSAFSEKSNRLL